jgi:cytoskeletal protein RodZ
MRPSRKNRQERRRRLPHEQNSEARIHAGFGDDKQETGSPEPAAEGNAVGGFGERLRREREMRSITLEEIAEATKIGTRSLKALEEEDFAKLPGGIFNKGFVRAYARYLGIDEEEAVADYQAALAEAMPVRLTEPQAETWPRPQAETATGGIPRARSVAPALLALIILGVLVYSGWAFYSQRQTDAAAREPENAEAGRAPSAAESIRVPSAAAATPAQAPPEEPTVKQVAATQAAARTQEFDVRIYTAEPTWVSIVADGEPFTMGILPAASEKYVRAQREVVVKMGHPRGVEVFHNDTPVPFEARVGRTRTLRFTAEGLSE